MSNDRESPTVEDDIAAKKSQSNGSPPSNGTAVRRIRKSNSGGQLKSGGKEPQRGTERSKSDSSYTGLTPRQNRQRGSMFSSKAGLDSSARSENSAASDDAESIGSYSLETDSICSKPLSNVKATIEKLNAINKECTVLNEDDGRKRNPPKRTGSRSSFGSKSSEKSDRHGSPHSVRERRTDPLETPKNRVSRRKSMSGSSDMHEEGSSHSRRGTRTLDPTETPKSRVSRRKSMSSDMHEQDGSPHLKTPLDNQRSRASRRKSMSGPLEVPERRGSSHSKRGGRTSDPTETPKSRVSRRKSMSSDMHEQEDSSHSRRGTRTSDPLDNQRSRVSRRRSMSGASELPERQGSPHLVRGNRSEQLDNQKSRSAYRRSNSRSSGLVEQDGEIGEAPLDGQKSRKAPKRTSSLKGGERTVSSKKERSSSLKGESPYTLARKRSTRKLDTSEPPKSPKDVDSPSARGRKKPASLRSFNDAAKPLTLTSPLVSARSRSKRSVMANDVSADAPFRSPGARSTSRRSLKLNDSGDGKRRSRSKSKSRSGGKLRSSSKKRTDRENGRRQYRRSRTPSKDEPLDVSSAENSPHRRKSDPLAVEDEIFEVLKTGEEEDERKAIRSSSRVSKSPRRDPNEKRIVKKSNSDGYRRARSNSNGNMEGKTRILRRTSDESLSKKDSSSKEPKRITPRRSKSNNIGIDSKALDSFLGGRRKKSSGSSVISGTKSLQLAATRTVVSTRSTKSNRNRQDTSGGKPLKPLSADDSYLPARLGADREYEEDYEFSFDSDYSDDDDRSVDLDLATARDNFAQQNLNAELQVHLNKTDELLYSVFPKHVADALRNGEKVAPENHDLVTIFFSDIVGFTDISARLDPLKISDMLDRLYNSFDTLSDYHDVFKVETIGDAYMAVTNLTKEQPDHCKRITEFAIDAIRVANQTLVDEENPSMGFVNIRVGFHSGPVVSNVVGARNPRYCLFGDTVNTASRMESNSEKNRIHCSEISATLLREQCPRMRIFSRGSIDVKGKGEMNTFWVHTEGSLKEKSKNQGAIRNFIQNAVRKR